MKPRLQYHLFLFFTLALFLQGCFKEDIDVTDPEKEVFNFLLTDYQREYINTSRGEQYEVTDPVPELQFVSQLYAVDRFESRGNNTLNLPQK